MTIIIFTFGLFFFVHEAEVSKMKEELDNALVGRQEEIEWLNLTLSDRIKDNEIINAEK